METKTAKEVMNTNILTAQADWPVNKLAEYFIENSISGAPVLTEDGELIGVVSMTDIIRQDILKGKDVQLQRTNDYYLSSLEERYDNEEVVTFRIKETSRATVKDIMTPVVFDVPEDMPASQVADMMIKGRIHRVFVTRNKELVGIISALDLLKIVREN